MARYLVGLFIAISLSGVSFADHSDRFVCDSEVRKFVIRDKDKNSDEFKSKNADSTAAFDMDLDGETHQLSNPEIGAWIGKSWGTTSSGSTWNQTRYQSFRLQYLRPGYVYRIKLKFWTQSVTSLTFRAQMDGTEISTQNLNVQTQPEFWVIEFRAKQRFQTVNITHDYAGETQTVRWAYLDHLEISEQPCRRDR